ncbi:hypothetical protein GCM10022252_19850 [Streptosporangium oxazolinicum]|uniref:Uncharacterized protein n=1 Tax=Streptosporangium oxazolinicum TaxID=909287 RepID=A0ABP8APB2_9ACTN
MTPCSAHVDAPDVAEHVVKLQNRAAYLLNNAAASSTAVLATIQ